MAPSNKPLQDSTTISRDPDRTLQCVSICDIESSRRLLKIECHMKHSLVSKYVSKLVNIHIAPKSQLSQLNVPHFNKLYSPYIYNTSCLVICLCKREGDKLRRERLGEEMSFQSRMEDTVGQVDSRSSIRGSLVRRDA